MAVQLNVNSYVTVAQADTFFTDRLEASAWATASLEEKGQALVTATQLLDDMTWAGTAVTEDQPLAFPRLCEYFDPKAGSMVYLDGTSVPGRVTRATMELALHLLANEGVLGSSGGVKKLVIGPIRLDGVKAVAKMPQSVSALVKPLLQNGGSSVWWRAN